MPEPGRAKRFVRRTLRRLILVGIVAALVVIGLATIALGRVELPDDVVLAETSIVYARDGTPIAEIQADENRFYVTLDEISPTLVDAVIAAEDRDFRSHSGVDPLAIARALWADLRAEGALQGGSTITQQYVKNVYLDADRTVTRKIREAALAIRLERELSKDEILERYLNTIYFGRGAYGIEAAARAYFGSGVTAADLGLAQSAYLAGLIRAPETADVSRPDQVAEGERRRATVLDAMVEEGYASGAERDAVLAVPVTDYVIERETVSTVRITDQARGAGVEWFVEEVRRELVERYDGSAVFGRGLRITTTLDLDAQRAAYDTLLDRVGADGLPSAALITLDDVGGVRAHVGGQDRAVSQVDLALGERGGGGGRQPASSFKALVLAAVVQDGISLSSRFPDPGTITLEGVDAGSDWTVSNFGGAAGGVSDLLRATARSSNTVYAQLIDEIGPEAVVELAAAMGVTSTLDPVHSLALGTEEVSVLDMAAAYSVLATRGRSYTPTWITEVTDGDGDVVVSTDPDETRVLSEQEADLVTVALRGVVEGGTGGRARVEGVPVAGKTGTTQDAADAWFVGYTPKYTTAIWLGYPDGRIAMTNVLGFEEVTGGAVPAELFSTYVSRLPDPAGGADFVDPGAFPGRVLGRDLDDGTTPPTTVAPSTTVAPEASTTVPPPPTTSSPAATDPPEPPTTTSPPEATEPAPSTTAPPTEPPAPSTTAPPQTGGGEPVAPTTTSG